MIRLFTALKIPEEAKIRLAEAREQILPGGGGYKWERGEKLHLTLKFIGETDEEKGSRIAEKLEFLEEYRKINCRIYETGFFYKFKEPKILWAGLDADKELFEIAGRIDKELVKFGVPAEKRKFKAHLTLLRIRSGSNDELVKLFDGKLPEEIKFTAEEIVLFKSELLKSGSRYTEIKTYRLK